MELFDNTVYDKALLKTDFSNPRVMRELHRLLGLLRFTPEKSGGTDRFIARCSPDHFVLPLMANHFWQRFGETSWAIIDEKRNFVLSGEKGAQPVLRRINSPNSTNSKPEQKYTSDEWEELWKNYHRSINNKERANPKLQKQFIPSRYRKYLPEME